MTVRYMNTSIQFQALRADMVSHLLDIVKNQQEITALKTDKGKLTSTDEEIAELLNEYFSTVFTNELTKNSLIR